MAYKCPYCSEVCFDDGTITKRCYESHDESGVDQVVGVDQEHMPDVVILELSKCPNCGLTSVRVYSHFRSKNLNFDFSYPKEDVKNLPEYVPAAIRNDYLEAIAIVDLSPKASATLARRCLQGMIHDFWEIKEKNLNAEISTLKGKIPSAQWNAIDALRKIGNIGAHMESDINFIIDVESDEAQKLIKLIELLIDKWYIARHDEEELLAEITTISSEKEVERNSVASDSGSQ